MSFAGVLASPAAAETVATAASPDGSITVSVDLDNDGRPSYAVMHKGKPLIAPSRLGFLLTDAPKLERNFTLASQATNAFDETWDQPWGERKTIRNRYNELKVALKEKTTLGRQISIVFRVHDDGFGFRYVFPQQDALKTANIAEELTEFNLAENGTAWWIPAGEWNRYEYLYNRTKVSEIGRAHTPVTMKLDSGTHVSFHEAALVDYSAMWLQHVEGVRFKATLSPSSGPAKVVRNGAFHTPWRSIQISDTAGGLVDSSLILNLNDPNVLGDVSWVKPYKYVGVWWGMHLDTESWASGAKHGATTANTKRYIDFAAKNGMRGVLVEGWNKGWDGDWFADGSTFSFTQPYPDFDIEGLSAYGLKKGVHLIGHHETSANVAHYEDQLEAALDLDRRLGIDSIKTGYVADAGGMKVRGADGVVRFEWHDGQASARHHLKVVTEAAKRRIAVNAHEPIKDTGLRRTYPNWVAREGARGMEYNAWGSPPNPPEHEINLVFTRMLAGPMDYTPGVLSLEGRGQPLQSTVARQLALYVLLYSPIQMAADLPENYAKVMKPFQFIKDVPTDWADSRVLNGEIGDYVTIARKDRNSADWYLGAGTDENGRTIDVTLDFLDAGKTYTAQIYRDADDTDYRTDTRHHHVIETRQVRRGDRLSLVLAPGGGQAIRFVAR
ncbi:glycoside hydrolase family 97 protein [Sphingobium algorifonticola]|nr:glycoside hydrolase family 97 protein [Sphingobium algorifonticola]